MSDKAIFLIIIWMFVILIGSISIWISFQWNRQPRLTAVITAREHYERRGRTPAYWMVSYEFRDLEGNTKYDSCKWNKKEEPSVGEQISICYDSKKRKSVIEGTYTMLGAQILIAVLILWAVICSICVLNDIDVSRRYNR